MLKKPKSRKLFLLMKLECASPVTELFEFFRRNGTRLLENTKNLIAHQRSLMFWDPMQSDGQKMPVWSSETLNAVDCLENLNNYKRKTHFQDCIF